MHNDHRPQVMKCSSQYAVFGANTPQSYHVESRNMTSAIGCKRSPDKDAHSQRTYNVLILLGAPVTNSILIPGDSVFSLKLLVILLSTLCKEKLFNE